MTRVISFFLFLSCASIVISPIEISPKNASAQTIYIRPDGSIEGTTYIQTFDFVTYFLTNDIIEQQVVIQRSNILLQGYGNRLFGPSLASGSIGIYMESVYNVTLDSITIKWYNYGIYLKNCSRITLEADSPNGNSYGVWIANSSGNVINGMMMGNTLTDIVLASSDHNNITGGTLSLGQFGIFATNSSYNTISGVSIFDISDSGIALDSNCTQNNIAENSIDGGAYGGKGVSLTDSSNNTISNNIFSRNNVAIRLCNSSNNVINSNNVSNCWKALELNSSANNIFYHNRFPSNQSIQIDDPMSINTWDNGFPYGGNWWGDYLTRYPNATEIDQTGIWNTPYVIDENNIDRYPLIPEFSSLPILLLLINTTLTLIYLSKKKQKKATVCVCLYICDYATDCSAWRA